MVTGTTATTTLNWACARQLLERFALAELFVEDLGWGRLNEKLSAQFEERVYVLQGVAQKRGMAVFTCASVTGTAVPGSRVRREIERQVARVVHEHLIIFTNPDHTDQVWQWVREQPGRPIARREHHYHRGQPGDLLLQKLQAMAFSLDIEPLPDIDFNIRAGNTLVGFATYDEVEHAVTSAASGQLKILFDCSQPTAHEPCQSASEAGVIDRGADLTPHA